VLYFLTGRSVPLDAMIRIPSFPNISWAHIQLSYPSLILDRFCSILTYKASNLFQPSHIIHCSIVTFHTPSLVLSQPYHTSTPSHSSTCSVLASHTSTPVLSQPSHTSPCFIPAFTHQRLFYPSLHIPAPILSLIHTPAPVLSLPSLMVKNSHTITSLSTSFQTAPIIFTYTSTTNLQLSYV
jgi:hypothetical protein